MAMIVINGLVMWPEVQRILDSCCSWCTAVPPTYGRLDPSCLLYIAHARILDAAAHVCLKQLVLLYLVPSITRNLTTGWFFILLHPEKAMSVYSCPG
ncbi:hypothetical protein KY290_022740 [Solanum tuberosum]|uniref:Uncharacterized protein n=1 Tax=Solanum tuberosum TaxID=4113 RepID=A0ABQ7V7B4_SOLTU|nr:hypothetical protein KY290_022740 [Solanum tuberosum]